jgi:hypothetical protein
LLRSSGISANYPPITNWRIAAGRGITPEHDSKADLVVVLGQTLRRQLAGILMGIVFSAGISFVFDSPAPLSPEAIAGGFLLCRRGGRLLRLLSRPQGNRRQPYRRVTLQVTRERHRDRSAQHDRTTSADRPDRRGGSPPAQILRRKCDAGGKVCSVADEIQSRRLPSRSS